MNKIIFWHADKKITAARCQCSETDTEKGGAVTPAILLGNTPTSPEGLLVKLSIFSKLTLLEWHTSWRLFRDELMLQINYLKSRGESKKAALDGPLWGAYSSSQMATWMSSRLAPSCLSFCFSADSCWRRLMSFWLNGAIWSSLNRRCMEAIMPSRIEFFFCR